MASHTLGVKEPLQTAYKADPPESFQDESTIRHHANLCVSVWLQTLVLCWGLGRNTGLRGSVQEEVKGRRFGLRNRFRSDPVVQTPGSPPGPAARTNVPDQPSISYPGWHHSDLPGPTSQPGKAPSKPTPTPNTCRCIVFRAVGEDGWMAAASTRAG